MTLSWGHLVRVGAVAGLVAGLALGLFHLFFTEPLIDAAIAVEESAGRHEGGQTEVVSREMQRWGLVAGSAAYGVGLGALFGLAYGAVFARRSATGPAGPVLMGVAAYWSFFFLPFLKYPANPPGVGEPETIAQRQFLYLILILFSLLAAGLAWAAFRWLRLRRPPLPALASALAPYAVVAAALLVLMPPNPDPVPAPPGLLAGFRLLSAVGQGLLWLSLVFVFGHLVRLRTRA